jgi:hypothetical protein
MTPPHAELHRRSPSPEAAARGWAIALVCACAGLALGVGCDESSTPRQTDGAPAAAAPAPGPRGLSFASLGGVVAASPSKASVLVDRAGGSFQVVKRPHSQEPPKVALADAVGDLNGDGMSDLVRFYNSSEEGEGIEESGVTIYPALAYVALSRSGGTFRASHGVYESDFGDISSLAVGDLNADRKPDLAIAFEDQYSTSGVDVLLEQGNGAFGSINLAESGRSRAARFFPTGAGPAAVAIADLNGDGRRDVATANSSGTVSVLLNLGKATLRARRDYRIGPGAYALAIGDLNADGKPDLAVTRCDCPGPNPAAAGVNAVSVLVNRGGGTFGLKREYRTGVKPVSVAIGDLSGDRKPDIVTANNGASTVSILVNSGGGTFRPKLDYRTGSEPMSVAIGDINGDGTHDLVVPTKAGRPRELVSVLVKTPRLCNVQDASGMTATAATRTLARSGCGVRNTRHVRSTSVARGRVISQKPAFGAVPENRVVQLVVSAGPGPSKSVSEPSFASPVTYPIASGGQALAVADLNGDGKPDLVTVSEVEKSTASVLLNRGDGAFRPRRDYRTGSYAEALAVGDLNGDGKPEIVTANGETVSVLLNRDDGTYEANRDYPAPGSEAYETNHVAIGDINGDDKPDLVIVNDEASTVLFNTGNATFRPKRGLRGGGDAVAIGDLNGDGEPDLATEFGAVSVLLNRGDGAFRKARRTYQAGGDGSGVFLGDLNDDGRPDLVVTYPDGNTVQVLLNNGDSTFRPNVDYRTVSAPNWVAIGDLNGDATPDLVAAAESVSVMLNRGDGTFKPKLDYRAGRRSPSAIAVGDLNGDGWTDLATVNDKVVSVLINTSGRGRR